MMTRRTIWHLPEADLRDVSDAKEEALRQWDARLTAIFEEYETHPQRLRPLRAAMEERLMRAFAGLINQLRQQDLGVDRYIWRSRDDAKVRDSHADYDDQIFRWDQPPAGGHPGQAHNCRSVAEPVAPHEAMVTPVEYVPNIGGLPDVLPSPSELGSGLRALTRGGLAAVAAVGLEAFRRYADETAVQRSAERLGLDLSTVEGVLAVERVAGVERTAPIGGLLGGGVDGTGGGRAQHPFERRAVEDLHLVGFQFLGQRHLEPAPAVGRERAGSATVLARALRRDGLRNKQGTLIDKGYLYRVLAYLAPEVLKRLTCGREATAVSLYDLCFLAGEEWRGQTSRVLEE